MLTVFELNKLIAQVRERQRSFYVVVRMNFQHSCRVTYEQLIDMVGKYHRTYPYALVEGFIDSDGNLQVGLSVVSSK